LWLAEGHYQRRLASQTSAVGRPLAMTAWKPAQVVMAQHKLVAWVTNFDDDRNGRHLLWLFWRSGARWAE